MDINKFILPKKDSIWILPNSIRVKITDSCSWNCWWCHNEGTGDRKEKLTKDIDFFDREFWGNFTRLTKELNINEVHLTGGEPSLHPKINEIIKKLKVEGYIVKMTSMGGSKDIFDKIINSGINSINFSLHAIDDKDMYDTQLNRSKDWIDKSHKDLLDIIESSINKGVDISINTVISSEECFNRAENVINWASKRGIRIRLLNEVNRNLKSIEAIYNFLNNLGAKETRRKYIQGSSSGTIFYEIPKIGELGFKILVPNYSNSMCNGCSIKKTNKCGEYFYGVRLENLLGNYNIRLCVHKTDAKTYFHIEEFMKSKVFEELKMKIEVNGN